MRRNAKMRHEPSRLRRCLPINGREWREQVKHRLLDGYGVEDIALWLDCHPEHVALEIDRLRAAGEFQKWWGRSA
jgi:hypothetical protein